MAPKSPPTHHGAPPVGTPLFLARVLSLPALQQAVSLASHYYHSTKNHRVMGAAVRATEESMRAAAAGALPLATPLVQRVGGWQALDRWACERLEKMERAAPIITRPAEEVVEATRRNVLGAVAGDQVIVPPTLVEAIRARANRVMDGLLDNGGTRAVAAAGERSLAAGRSLLDHYLPGDTPGMFRRFREEEPEEGLVARASWLAREAARRLHRTSLLRMRPDLAFRPDAVITADILVTFVRATLLEWYLDILREPRPEEQRGLMVTLAHRSLALSASVAQLLLASLPASVQAAPDKGKAIALLVESRVAALSGALNQVSTQAAGLGAQLLHSATTLSTQAASRLASLLDAARETLGPMWQEVSADMSARFLAGVELGRQWASAGQQRLAAGGGRAAEEGQVWGSAGLTLLLRSPRITLRVLEITRVAAAGWLRERLIREIESRNLDHHPGRRHIPLKVIARLPRGPRRVPGGEGDRVPQGHKPKEG